MIRRRKITAKNRPTNAKEAFDLYAELTNNLPTKQDAAASVAQIRTTYIESVNALTAHLERRIDTLQMQNAAVTHKLDKAKEQLKQAHILLEQSVGKPSLWLLLRYVLRF